ncbi:RNase adapter RapZ [Pueribacillus theae]|uniref:RNase adapter RapZ n=1 Tax=Pueribacillus theae TaxID=2171751 RepID=UPI0023E7DCE1|nr:RNase adapter RapZ [Pueribacillus theae]
MEEKQDIHVVIITGMSGAGKSVAMRSFEDMGYFCVDNLPPALMMKFIELVEDSRGEMNKIALVMDLRGRDFFDSLVDAIVELGKYKRINPQILFLEANDTTLVRRYKEARRSHPLAPSQAPLNGIKKERSMLEELKGHANLIIDTSQLKPLELREKITNYFLEQTEHNFTLNVMSFGFKHGIPIDADLVFDIRFLPNPHYIDTLRPKTGLEEDVSSYVMRWPETKEFVDKIIDLLVFLLPHYKREGKSQLVVGIGCTGGKHRSVALAEYIGKAFAKEYQTRITHRDIEKGIV